MKTGDFRMSNMKRMVNTKKMAFIKKTMLWSDYRHSKM